MRGGDKERPIPGSLPVVEHHFVKCEGYMIRVTRKL